MIQSLHLHIDSLKQQVGSLLDESEAKDRMLQAVRQQVEVRDNRIKGLLQQLAESQGQLADATSVLEARSALLKQREQELAEKDAELSALRLSRQSQQQQRLQRVGSGASTTHRYGPAMQRNSSSTIHGFEPAIATAQGTALMVWVRIVNSTTQ